MRSRNPSPGRPDAVLRGRVKTNRAASTGIRVFKVGGENVDTVTDVELVGLGLEDLGEDGIRITAGGGGGAGSGGSTAGIPVLMLNNSGSDLMQGAVVVTDDSEDNAVTTTTTPGNTRIVGVLQEDIPAGDIGPVLFNGFTAGIITTGTASRGDYLQTSAIAGAAQATADREAGSFAVVTAAAGIVSMFTDYRVTESAGSVTSLAITIPSSPVPPVGRVLFLALYRDPSVTTAVTLTGWTRIGSTSGFWYYYRVATGSDAATATWSTISPAVGIVALLDSSVDPGSIVASQAFDATTAAAALSGLTGVHFALSGVADELSADPTDWSLIAAGSASAAGSSPDLNLAGTVTVGSTTVAAPTNPANANDGNAATYSEAANTASGGSPIERWWISDLGAAAAVSSFTLRHLPSSANSLETWLNTAVGTTGAHSARFQYSTVGTSGPWTSVTTTQTATDVGASPETATWSFASVTARYWRIYLEGKYTSNFVEFLRIYTWEIRGAGTLLAEGSLVGRYIGRDAAVTSPFTGTDDAFDALFALNLAAEPLPSALLYGPDLTQGLPPLDPGDTGAFLIWDGDSWEPGYPGVPLVLEDGTLAVLEDGSLAIGEPTFI